MPTPNPSKSPDQARPSKTPPQQQQQQLPFPLPMDPTAALGLASDIFAFTHFASGLLGGAKKVLRTCRHKSDHIHVNRVQADLGDLTRALAASQAMCAPERHRDLVDMAASCQAVSRDMTAMLCCMQASNGTSWDNIRAAIRNLRENSGTVDMQTHLGSCRSRIVVKITEILRKHHLALEVALWDLHPRHQTKTSVKLATELRRLRDLLRDFTETGPRANAGVELQGCVGNARDAVDDLLATLVSPSPEILILKELYPRFVPNPAESQGLDKAASFSWITNTGATREASSSNLENGSDAAGRKKVSEIENTDSGLDLTAQNKPASAAKVRAHARWSLVSWLEAGDGIFHISGRAGSGKSALMRFLAHDAESAVRLSNWAGERKLLVSHILVPKTHRPRNGLYRTVLFEVLRWIPALTRDVFADAHAAFENRYPASLVRALFLDEEAVDRAFEALVSLDIGDDCRICLFIDGLDQYTGGFGGSYHDSERLAEKLWRWVRSRRVKILISSRHGRGISSIFPEKNRIRLETVTGPDIEKLCRRMLEEDGACGDRVSLCWSLIRAIVRRADGNFLWARLATTYLLGYVRAGHPLSSVESTAESLPQDIMDMYSVIFDAIEETTRAKVFRMLLLVAGHPRRSMTDGGIDTIQLSWVGDLDDPDFPINRPRVPYSTAELESRQLLVRHQIENSAHVFLAIKGAAENGSIVDFSHRTVAEWVDKNEQMQQFRPRVASPDTYTRITLAELWYESFTSESIGHARGWWLPVPSLDHPGCVCRKELLDGFINVHAKFGGPYTLYGRSFLHRLAHSHAIGYYFRWKAAQYELIDEDGAPELSLLATSLLGGQVENVRTLLELGMSPWRALRVRSHTQPKYVDVSIWVVYLWNFAERIIYGIVRPDSLRQRTSGVSITACLATTEYWTMLKMLLEAGCDPECSFLLSERVDNIPTHAISLRRLISNSQKPEGIEIPMEVLRGSHHPGVTGCKPYGLYKQEVIPGLGDGSYDIDRAKFKLVSVKCGGEELEWPFSKVQVY